MFHSRLPVFFGFAALALVLGGAAFWFAFGGAGDLKTGRWTLMTAREIAALAAILAVLFGLGALAFYGGRRATRTDAAEPDERPANVENAVARMPALSFWATAAFLAYVAALSVLTPWLWPRLAGKTPDKDFWIDLLMGSPISLFFLLLLAWFAGERRAGRARSGPERTRRAARMKMVLLVIAVLGAVATPLSVWAAWRAGKSVGGGKGALFPLVAELVFLAVIAGVFWSRSSRRLGGGFAERDD